MSPIEAFLFFMVYFAPLIVAFGRGMERRWWLTLALVLTGWTVIGWVACAVWAFVGRGKKQAARDAVAAERVARLERELLAAKAQPLHVTVHNTTSAKEA